MTSGSDDRPLARAAATELAHAGRGRDLAGPFANPPVVHASTVLFDTVEAMESGGARYVYGRRGTPTSEALESAMAGLEGAAGTVLVPSGLAAISTSLLSCLEAGQHLLMSDSVYGPARHFANTVLARFGVETTYFDPTIGAGIETLFRERTAAVYLESPGSLTFEMQDIPALAAVAHARNATVLADNTWATPLYCRMLDLGVDISVVSGTKYIAGHSDVMIGLVSANAERWPALKRTHGALGLCVGPDDVYLTLRGLRTLDVRLARHGASALKVAAWLADRAEIARVLHPGLPGAAGHDLWKRQMSGSSGLFSFVFAGWEHDRARRFVNALDLFGIGASWGGFESLAIVAKPEKVRLAVPWQAEGALIRLHVGLEDPDDLIADLAQALEIAAG